MMVALGPSYGPPPHFIGSPSVRRQFTATVPEPPQGQELACFSPLSPSCSPACVTGSQP